jgi:putative alpha-1,2-mannosidase
LEDGHKLQILGNNASLQNKYIQSLKLNGKPWNRNWLTHDELRNGATLEFEMGPKPSTWGQSAEPPPSLSSAKPTPAD